MALTKLYKTILDTIAYYEGTLGKSLNGYDLLFGGKKVMNGWTPDTTQIRHRCIKPRGSVTKQKIESEGFQVCEDETWQDKFTRNGVVKTSTAAGRYQYLGWSWANTTEKLGLGFNAPMSKENQNKAALRGVKDKRKVTETDLRNALSSLDNFKIVLEKLKEEWTSMKGALNGSYHKTVEQGWEFYKGAYQRYENANSSGTQNGSSGAPNTLYLDKDGKTISKFGTSTGSGDKNKFYLNVPSGSSDKILYIWPERENYISREDSWGQVPTSVRESAYIIMAAGVVNNNLNSTIDDMNKAIKGWNSGLRVNTLKKYVMGVGNRANLAVPYYNTYELTGLVDPNPGFDENYFTKKANKVYMISGSQNYINTNGAKIKKIQSKIVSDGGFSIEEQITDQALRQWFNNYASAITTGTPPQQQQTTNTSNCNSNPNASYLRQVMSTLNYKEKIYVKGKGKYIVPSLDTSTGCYKLDTTPFGGSGFKDGEMSNGGDIDEKLSIVSAAIFTKVKEKHPSYIIIATGGNDKFHQGLNYTSRHKEGRGMDIVVDGASRSCTNDSKWGRVSKPGTKIQNVIDVIRSYSASGSGGKVYNKLRYIDEYCNKSSAATGDHIHFSWGTGSEGKARAELAKSEANNSQLEVYNVNDLFS